MIGLAATALVDGLIFSLVGFALLISFGWLRFPDLTPDGSFVLGGAVYAALVAGGLEPALAMILSLLAGATAGVATALLSTLLRIPPVIAGLITVTGLFSVSWVAMGKPTEFVHSSDMIWTSDTQLGVTASIVFGAMLLIWMGSRTLGGLRLRAFGENPLISRQLRLNGLLYTSVGLGLANLMVALAGALFAQRIFVADVNSGVGVTLVALVPLFAAGGIAGTSRRVLLILILVGVFSFLYRLVFGLVLLLDVPGELFRLVSAFFLVGVFAIAVRENAPIARRIRWN